VERGEVSYSLQRGYILFREYVPRLPGTVVQRGRDRDRDRETEWFLQCRLHESRGLVTAIKLQPSAANCIQKLYLTYKMLEF
jgi:hypothetical protein